MDAWMDLRLQHADGRVEQVCIGWEVDFSTEWQAAWRRKVRALLAFDRGPYARAFGVDVLIIAVVAPSPERCGQLRSWTEQELLAQSAGSQADLFSFATMPDDRTDATGFFFDRRWYLPGAEHPAPLIDLDSVA